jgi:transcriptional regulator with XRE-family HTH domain
MKISNPFGIRISTIVDMNWKEKLGEEIRRARKRKGMTREELFQALQTPSFSISLTSIGNYERGERAPDFEDLRQIAVALGEDHFEVDDNFRVEFGSNGRPHPEVQPQQLNLFLDERSGVNVRIEAAGQSLIIKKLSA